MATQRLEGDLYVTGSIASGGTMSVGNGSIRDAQVASNAAIDVDKMAHLHRVQTDFGVANNTAPSADVYKTIYTAISAATLRIVKAKLFDTGTSTDVKFNLYKSAAGSTTLTTVLSATIDLTHSSTDNTFSSGTISTSAIAAGDQLTAFMDYTSATGAQGPCLLIEIEEAAN